MSLIIAHIRTPYDLYRSWLNELREYVQSIVQNPDEIYLVFVDSKDTVVYFPNTKLDNDIFVLPDGMSPQLNPVYCSHAENLTDISFSELTGIDNMPFSECDLDDIEIGYIVQSHIQLVPINNIQDKELKYLFEFQFHAHPDFDNSTLFSYLKYLLINKGEKYTISEQIVAKKHTQLELGSELIKCNYLFYNTYKNMKTKFNLLNILDNSRSKFESEHLICGLVHEILNDHVVNCMGELWYFEDSIWKECSADGYLWNFLTTNFIDYLHTNNADKLALFIMSITTRSKLLKDVKLRLQDDSFTEKLDTKRHLINMTNGVYNTDTEILSHAVPSDYVSITTNVPYQIFDAHSAEITQLMSILETIFPEPDLLDYFITSCSSFLEGYNSPKLFYIWWGTGNNAKSLIQTLVMKTFGEYCSTAPTSLVTGKRGDSSGATPELCHVEKRLIVFLQEPNPEERIKVGRVKEMTGNDTMYVRQLFKAGKTITIKSKFVLVCNNIIEIPGMDAAIRRRLVVLPFLSTFLDPMEYQDKQQKGTLAKYSQIINPSIEKDLLSCTSAFMYLLCRKYSEYKEFSIPSPPIIKQTTEYYMTKNNYPLKFINNFVHRATGYTMQVTEIYELYKDWYRKSYPSKRVQDYEIFLKELNDEGYKEDDNGVFMDTYVNYTGELSKN